jgi:hypothetical protein
MWENGLEVGELLFTAALFLQVNSQIEQERKLRVRVSMAIDVQHN